MWSDAGLKVFEIHVATEKDVVQLSGFVDLPAMIARASDAGCQRRRRSRRPKRFGCQITTASFRAGFAMRVRDRALTERSRSKVLVSIVTTDPWNDGIDGEMR